jgi:transcriptional regulator with XRE-family HTH domain
MDAATLLRGARTRAGLSQRDLARRARTSPAAVCLYETGQRVPRVDTLARLVAATGSTLEVAARSPAPTVDLAANARTLEELLDLADHLPQRHDPELRGPRFRDLAR